MIIKFRNIKRILFGKIGGIELFEQHESLKDTTKLTRELERQLKERQEALVKEEAINSRLASQVSSFLEKKKFEDNLLWLKRKKSVLVYKEKRSDHERVKGEREKLLREISDLNESNEPMKEKKSEIEKKLAKFRNVLSTKVRFKFNLASV